MRPNSIVLSCPCRWCELNWRQVKTVFSIPQYIWDWTVANWKLGWDKTKLSSHRISRQDKTAKKRNMLSSKFSVFDSLDLWPIQFTPPTRTRQDKTRQWCELGTRAIILHLLSWTRLFGHCTQRSDANDAVCSETEAISFALLCNLVKLKKRECSIEVDLYTIKRIHPQPHSSHRQRTVHNAACWPFQANVTIWLHFEYLAP